MIFVVGPVFQLPSPRTVRYDEEGGISESCDCKCYRLRLPGRFDNRYVCNVCFPLPRVLSFTLEHFLDRGLDCVRHGKWSFDDEGLERRDIVLTFTSGDMFAVEADIRVNTVNCVGVMGAGVALAFKKRYPAMFRDYVKKCKAGKIRIGQLDIWKTSTEWIVNFPTKQDWRVSSKYEYVESGLIALRIYLKQQGRVRVVLPALGCGHGGLEWDRIKKTIGEWLHDLEAEIFVFEPADSHRL